MVACCVVMALGVGVLRLRSALLCEAVACETRGSWRAGRRHSEEERDQPRAADDKDDPGTLFHCTITNRLDRAAVTTRLRMGNLHVWAQRDFAYKGSSWSGA